MIVIVITSVSAGEPTVVVLLVAEEIALREDADAELLVRIAVERVDAPTVMELVAGGVGCALCSIAGPATREWPVRDFNTAELDDATFGTVTVCDSVECIKLTGLDVADSTDIEEESSATVVTGNTAPERVPEAEGADQDVQVDRTVTLMVDMTVDVNLVCSAEAGVGWVAGKGVLGAEKTFEEYVELVRRLGGELNPTTDVATLFMMVIVIFLTRETLDETLLGAPSIRFISLGFCTSLLRKLSILDVKLDPNT